MSVDRSHLPQLATPSNAVVRSVEWLFEPCWKGDRLMARVDNGRVTLTDGQGQSADGTFAEAAAVLEPVVDADQALIDGIWTNQPCIGFEDQLPDPIENETRRAFVALDLVELDGQPLHHVPYLERRRLLASVVEENVRVRVTPAVRLPLDRWLVAWRMSGFGEYVAKHMNSRYRPGGIAEDWLRISTGPMRGPSIAARLIGRRSRRVVYIEDGAAPVADRVRRP